jgi:glycosyltransferase involved in cell wall biosynthesis
MPGGTPLVSIVLPTFNRETFLDDAFQSIAAQTYPNWELIVVDDGSTDNTTSAVRRLSGRMRGPCTYIRQENRGAYAARNVGVTRGRGELFAFFDSDDLWLPHHLSRCVDALKRHEEVDWVYGACQRIDHASGRVVDESSFFVDGAPRPFLSLHTRRYDDLRIVDDSRSIECQLVYGFYCGLQNSVIRRRLLADSHFDERYRVVEDELFFIKALTRGARVAYYMEPHVVYRVHGANSSASSNARSDEQSLAIFRELVEGFERLRTSVAFTRKQRRALRRRLSNEYFWHLGYNGYWRAGKRQEALAAYRRGLSFRPLDLRLWKSYMIAVARTCVARGTRGAHT